MSELIYNLKDVIVWFGIGVMFGAFIGFFVIGFLQMASKADREIERMLNEEAQNKKS